MTDRPVDDDILDTFASLADTLIEGYDVVELLQLLVEACARLVDVSAAGILLADEYGQLEVVASTSEETRLVEVMQLSADAGPCIECFLSAKVVSVPDVSEAPARWGAFRDEALRQGFQSVYAIPLRLRDSTIGALNLMRRETTGELRARDIRAAQALANVATIGILHERSMSEADVLRDQLTNALQSRVVIEQAKGVVFHLKQISTNEAFKVIRDYARSHRLPLSGVARDIVQRTLKI